MSRDPQHDWAVVIPAMGPDFHRINSLDNLYNWDTVVAYGLDKDKSWILYILLSEMGMDTVLNTPMGEVMKLTEEVKKLSWLEAIKVVERLKAEGYQ